MMFIMPCIMPCKVTLCLHPCIPLRLLLSLHPLLDSPVHLMLESPVHLMLAPIGGHVLIIISL